jgi:hypothetical protein
MAYETRRFKCHIHKGSPIIHILNQINPIPRIDTYFFKVHSNIVLPSIPVGLPVKTLKALLPSSILASEYLGPRGIMLD